MDSERFGLCATCSHQQVVRSGRGSVFSLCRRHKEEPKRYPKYPRVPVVRCAGYAFSVDRSAS